MKRFLNTTQSLLLLLREGIEYNIYIYECYIRFNPGV